VPASDLTAARLRRPGPGGARILLVAGRSWLTTTRASDQERVPVRLLDRLWLSTRRGVELDVVCGVSRVLRLLESPNDGWDLQHYDAVVLLPDPGRSALPARLQRVIDQLAGLTRVLGVSDTAIRPGDPVPSDGDAIGWEEIRIASSRQRSASLVADAVGAALHDVLDHDENADVQAPTRIIGIGEHLQRIALLASTALEVGSVAITALVAGQPRTLATVGPVIGDHACLRAGAVRAVVVLDAWHEHRPAGEVRPLGAVRFFAAHPLELADGSAMGALSVFDAQPRTADEFDADVLHDLAVLTSAELQYAGPRT
jgi:hypothetical protein